MDAIRLFFKRLFCRLLLLRSTKAELLNMLKTPDKDVADIIWMSYIREIRHIGDLMVVVYDDYHEFCNDTRVLTGMLVLSLLDDIKVGLMSMPSNEWFNPRTGRLACLVGVGLYLPELRDMCNSVVRRFFPHERCAFANAWW